MSIDRTDFFFYCKPDPFLLMTYECERRCWANTHLLQPLSLRGHVQLQAVKRGRHLAQGEFDRLLLKHNGVAVGLLEARRLVILRGDCRAQDKGETHNEQMYIYRFVFFLVKCFLILVYVQLNGNKALID